MKPLFTVLLLFIPSMLLADPILQLGLFEHNFTDPYRASINAYFNPATLGMQDKFNTLIGYGIYKPNLSGHVVKYATLGNIKRFRGTDSKTTAKKIDAAFGGALDLDPVEGFYFGQVIAFKRLFPDLKRRISAGIFVFIPHHGTNIVKISGQDPQTPQFPYSGRNDQHLVVSLSAGMEVIKKRLFLGAGALILSDITGVTFSSTPIAVFDPDHPDNPAPPQPSTAAFSQDLTVDAAPQFGLIARPLSWLDIALSYRGEMSLDLDFTAQAGIFVDLGTPLKATLPFHLHANFFYLPAVIDTTLLFHPLNQLTIATSLQLAFTKDYSHHISITTFELDPSAVGQKGEIIELQNFGNLRATDTHLPVIHTRNTLVPSISITYLLASFSTSISGSYMYQPSPLSPNQNYDNFVISSGLHSFNFSVSWHKSISENSSMALQLAANAGVFNKRYDLMGNSKNAKGIFFHKGYFLGANTSISFNY